MLRVPVEVFLRPLQRCISTLLLGERVQGPSLPYTFLCVTSLLNASCSSCCCKKGKQAHFEIHGITANGRVVKSWSAMPEVHKGPNPWLCVSCPSTQILNPDPNLAVFSLQRHSPGAVQAHGAAACLSAHVFHSRKPLNAPDLTV